MAIKIMRRFALGDDDLKSILAEYGIHNPERLPKKGTKKNAAPVTLVNTSFAVSLGYPATVLVEIATGTDSPKTKFRPEIVGYFIWPKGSTGNP